jgi:hypothetical protein
MGRTCSTYGEKKRWIEVSVRTTEDRRPLENRGADGRIILEWIFERLDAGEHRLD